MSSESDMKRLVVESFAKVEPIAGTAASLFYNRLWEIDPETKELFEDTDMEKQKEKLMKTLKVAVDLLTDGMDTLVPVLQDLGRRHVDYGVKAHQYATVGEALIWTLGEGLGDAFTPEVKEAWVWVFGVISEVCINAAKDVDPTYGEEAGKPVDEVAQRKKLIVDSFAKVEPIAGPAAGMFYNRLWEIDPETKELFEDTDMEKQKEKLMKTLKVAVDLLTDGMDTLVPVLQDLGRRHVDYGVKAHQYATVGEALIWTLGEGLGDAFTPEVKEAWVWVFGVISEVCINAAKDVDPTYGTQQ
ncbi:unnamed protein product [Chrysoparadoxa australica]